MYTEDFFIRHRQLIESDDNVLFMHTPRNQGKSWGELILHKQRTTGKVECFQMYIDDFYYKRTKLLQSKSKKSRVVSVVCK